MPYINRKRKSISAKFKPYGKKKNYKKSKTTSSKTRSKRSLVKVAKVDAPKKIATSHWKSTGGELAGKSKPMKGESISTSIFTKTSSGRVKGTDAAAGQVASLMTAVYPRTDLMSIRGSLSTEVSKVSAATGDNGYSLYSQPIALFKSAVVEHFITNQTNGNVFVDLYEVVSKMDQGLSPEISTQAEITTPLEAFDNGLAANGLNNFSDRAGGVYSYPGSTTMGVTPTMSQQFKALWKILKKTTLCLGSGETVQHSSVHKPNYKFDYAKTRGEGTTTETVEEAYVRGLTVFTMAIVHGMPCDLDADGTVGLTLPEINWTSNVVYRTTAFPASKSTNAAFVGGVTTLAAGKIFTQTAEQTAVPS